MGFSMRCLSMKCLVLLVMIIGCWSITTTSHDKPDDTKLPVMAKLMRQEEEIPQQSKNGSTLVGTENVTNLPSSERQKRLLPYMTFYLAHDFNLPSDSNGQQGGQVYQTPQGTRYQLIETPLQQKPATTYQQFHDKFTELTSNQQGQQQQSYQSKIKFTPFLEANALPGPFHPMRQHQVAVKSPSNVPNFSQIYDKLARLRLQQQQPAKGYSRYQPFQYQQQQQGQKQQINYIPLLDYQEVPPTQLDQDKTIVHTYESTNIDIPTNQHDKPQPESHHHHQQQFIGSAPHQDHVQPVTSEEYKQYLEDTQKYTHQEIRRPQVQQQQQVPQQQHHQQQPSVIVLRQKPIRLIPHKIIYEDSKPSYQQEVSVPQKQLVYVRKPQVSSIKQSPQVFQIVIPQQKYEGQGTRDKYQGPSYELVNGPGITPNKINNYENVRYETIKYVSKPQQQQQQSYPQVVYPNYQVPKYIQATTPSPYNPPIVKHQHQHISYTTHKPKTHYQSVIVSNAPTQSNREYYHDHHNQQQAEQHLPQYSSPTAVGVTTDIPYLPTENSNSLSIILKKLQDTNALPVTLTPDNIDNSIKTLVKILSSLKKQQHFSRPIVVADESPSSGTSTTATSGEQGVDNVEDNEAGVGLGGDVDVVSQSYPLDTQEGGTPGKPGVDYPALSTIPKTSFRCKSQRYKGFFGDPDTHCQVWHYCDLNGGQASFLCPNGTIFSQVALTCDWWYNVKCSTTTQLYVLNERLYKYILPLSPKFPEDYSGPLVDRYLALKFKEMEDKMKKQRKQNNTDDQHNETEDSEDTEEEKQEGKPEESEEASKLINASTEAIHVEDKSTESNSEGAIIHENVQVIEEQ